MCKRFVPSHVRKTLIAYEWDGVWPGPTANRCNRKDIVCKKKFSTSAFNEIALRMEKYKSCFCKIVVVCQPWGNKVYAEQSLENKPGPKNDTIEWLWKYFSSHAVRVPLHLETETVMQVDQSHALHKFVLSVSRSGYVPGVIFPSSK